MGSHWGLMGVLLTSQYGILQVHTLGTQRVINDGVWSSTIESQQYQKGNENMAESMLA